MRAYCIDGTKKITTWSFPSFPHNLFSQELWCNCYNKNLLLVREHYFLLLEDVHNFIKFLLHVLLSDRKTEVTMPMLLDLKWV